MLFWKNMERVQAAAGAGRVLDVGGWADPLPRADYVLDRCTYETRSLAYHGVGRLPDTVLYPNPRPGERFRKATWILHDICGPKPFPFPDKMFDFVVCSHTLEDVEDPAQVCAELIRVARAGYVETPSWICEQTRGFHGGCGAAHHHWVVEYTGPKVRFLRKPSATLSRRLPHLPVSYTHRLSEDEKVGFLFWERAFDFEVLDADQSAARCAALVRMRRVPAWYYARDIAGKFKWRFRSSLTRACGIKPPVPEGFWTAEKLTRDSSPASPNTAA